MQYERGMCVLEDGQVNGGREVHLVNGYQLCSWGNRGLFFGILVLLMKIKIDSKGSLRTNFTAFMRKVRNLVSCQEEEREKQSHVICRQAHGQKC